MSAAPEVADRLPAHLARVWAGTLLPAVAWFADLEISLALTRTAVATERRGALFLVMSLALVVCLLCLLSSRREWRRQAPPARTVAGWGLGLGLFFLLLIAAMAVPLFVFHPRDLP
jgi:hypothetical protein